MPNKINKELNKGLVKRLKVYLKKNYRITDIARIEGKSRNHIYDLIRECNLTRPVISRVL